MTPLKLFCDAHGLTQRQLAVRLGLSLRTVQTQAQRDALPVWLGLALCALARDLEPWSPA